MPQLARRFPLVTFFILAYGLSWAYWIPLAVSGARVGPGSSTTHLPGLAGPALAAFLTLLIARDRAGVRTLLTRLFLISSSPWRFAFYSLTPLVFLVVALALAGASGARVPPLEEFARYSGVPSFGLPIVFTLVLLFNGFGEETGWRGFALPRLQARFGPLGGALVLAVLWAGWHAPTFAVVETYRSLGPALLVFGFGLGLACGSVVLARVAHVTGGSVLAVALWHALYNMTSATAASQGLIGAVTTTCVMAWAAVLVAVEWRRRGASVLLVAMPASARDEQRPV